MTELQLWKDRLKSPLLAKLRQILDHHHRGCGDTTALVKGAKENNGIILCGTQQHAEEIKRKHGVTALTVHNPDTFNGLRVPFLVDNHLLRQLLYECFDAEAVASELLSLYRAQSDRLQQSNVAYERQREVRLQAERNLASLEEANRFLLVFLREILLRSLNLKYPERHLLILEHTRMLKTLAEKFDADVLLNTVSTWRTENATLHEMLKQSEQEKADMQDALRTLLHRLEVQFTITPGPNGQDNVGENHLRVKEESELSKGWNMAAYEAAVRLVTGRHDGNG